jgi:hypothetical protein
VLKVLSTFGSGQIRAAGDLLSRVSGDKGGAIRSVLEMLANTPTARLTYLRQKLPGLEAGTEEEQLAGLARLDPFVEQVRTQLPEAQRGRLPELFYDAVAVAAGTGSVSFDRLVQLAPDVVTRLRNVPTAPRTVETQPAAPVELPEALRSLATQTQALGTALGQARPDALTAAEQAVSTFNTTVTAVQIQGVRDALNQRFSADLTRLNRRIAITDGALKLEARPSSSSSASA